MTKLLYKPDWQKGRKTELKNDIMIRLSIGEYSIAKLAKEFKHFVKKNDPKSGIDHQRVYNAMTALRDFYEKNDGFVEQLEYFSGGIKRGRHGKIWSLTKNGTLSLLKIQDPKEFFEMVFFSYDKYYHHSKNIIPIEELITQYENNQKLYRHKINSEIDLQIWNNVKNILYSDKDHSKIYPILKTISIKKQMSESEIIQYLKESGKTDDECYEEFQLCYDNGLIMDIESEKKFYLSIFGYLLLISTFSIKKTYFDEEFEKEFDTIRENYNFIFPKIIHNYVSQLDYIHIIRQIFLGHTSTEDNELDLNNNRILSIQTYFEKIEQSRFRIMFQDFVQGYQEWCNKHECHIFPFTSNFKMSPIHFLEMIIDKDIPIDKGLIKGIIDENTHKIKFEIKDLHGPYLENNDGEDFGINLSSEEWEKYQKLLIQINHVFIICIQKKSVELDLKSIDVILSVFGNNEQKTLRNSIQKTFENVQHLVKCIEPLKALYSLSNKIEKINEFNIPTDQRMQHFYSFEHFNEDDNTMSIQDIIQFQFITYLKSYNPKASKNLLKDSTLAKWYNAWIRILFEFHKNEDVKLQMYNFD